MNILKSIAIFCVLLSVGGVEAKNNIHSLYGKVVSIDKANAVTVRLNGTNSAVSVHIEGVDVGEIEGLSCGSNQIASTMCAKLEELVKDKSVGVVVTGRESISGGVLGDLIVNGKSVSRHMVLQGWYRMDWEKTRTMHLILAEKEARCHYRGIWLRYLGDPKVAYDCKGV